MFFRKLLGFVARARAPDKEFSILSYQAIPELSTLIAAPDQVHAQNVTVVHDPTHHTLHVTIAEKKYVFALREDHILVFSEEPFSTSEFRTELKEAVMKQRASTKSIPARFQERVSETAQ